MLATIAFAIKILFTILCVVVLSLGKSSIITRDKVGLFSLIGIISTSLIIFSVEVDSFLIPAAFFIVISFLSYERYKNINSFNEILEKLAPYWIIILIGMTMGYGRFLQSFILTFASYYLLNYMSIILPEKNQKVEK